MKLGGIGSLNTTDAHRKMTNEIGEVGLLVAASIIILQYGYQWNPFCPQVIYDAVVVAILVGYSWFIVSKHHEFKILTNQGSHIPSSMTGRQEIEKQVPANSDTQWHRFWWGIRLLGIIILLFTSFFLLLIGFGEIAKQGGNGDKYSLYWLAFGLLFLGGGVLLAIVHRRIDRANKRRLGRN